MKKIIPVLMIIVLMLSLVISVSAEDTRFSMKVTSSASKVKPGEQFTVTFLVADITESSGLLAMEIGVEYDVSKVIIISKSNVYPSQWGKYGADFSPALPSSQTGSWDQRLLYDGDDYEDPSIPLFKDNELGVIITFKALENASGNAKIGTSSEVYATSNELESVRGKSGSVIITISDDSAVATTEKEITATSAAGPTTVVTSEKTQTTAEKQTQTSAAPITTDSVSGTISEVSPSDSGAASSTAVSSAVPSQATSAAAEITSASPTTTVSEAPAASASPATTEKGEDKGNGALTVIILITAVAVAAIVLFAVIKFRAKNDDNPVNPS